MHERARRALKYLIPSFSLLSLVLGFAFLKWLPVFLVVFLCAIAAYVRIGSIRRFFSPGIFKVFAAAIVCACVLFFLVFGYLIHKDDGYRVAWHNIDSISYFIQARIFSSGHINVPSHPLKDFFSTRFCLNDGKYFSKYFPGWPLLLSLGVSLGAPWILNPLLGFLTAFLIYRIGKELYDGDTGIVAALLFLTSRNFYNYTPTYFSEPASLFFAGLFFHCMVRQMKTPEPRWTISAGILLGITFLMRPYSAISVSLPIVSYFFLSSFRSGDNPRSRFAMMALSFLPAVLLLLAYNYAQTGSALLSPFQQYSPLDKPGFGIRRSDPILPPRPFTLFRAFENSAQTLSQLNADAVPLAFLFLAVAFLYRPDKRDYLLFATFFSVVLFHFFYFYKGTRYYYIANFAFFLLIARGINSFPAVFEKYFPKAVPSGIGKFLCILLTIANVSILNSPNNILHDYDESRALRKPFDLAKECGMANSVLFMRIHGGIRNTSGIYIQNPLDYRGDVLFAKDLGERNAELMNYYRGKNFYYCDFDHDSFSSTLTRIDPPRDTSRRPEK